MFCVAQANIIGDFGDRFFGFEKLLREFFSAEIVDVFVNQNR